MTNTAKPARRVDATARPAPPPRATATPLSRESGESLVEQIVRTVESRIADRLLRPGARMPSIRQYAEQQGVSRFTVVEAYDRLVARGCLESRRGSGFYVRDSARAPLRDRASAARARQVAEERPAQLDVTWLVRNIFRENPPGRMPGSGLLPPDWLDDSLVADALRSVARQHPNLLHYGTPQGFLPLRQQLQRKLAELEIPAAPEQIITTLGVTHALNLVTRQFTRPGDTIFVEDPAWFLMFGSFTALGAKIIGIPRQADGPDIALLAELAAIHKPRLFVINSVVHNPTSSSLSAAKAFQILKLAEQHDFLIVEDDIYGDLHPGSAIQPAMRVAALDQLQRVIYLGGFSKTMAANLRVGYIACAPEHVMQLTDQKMLSTLTTSELGERVAYKVLSEGQYRKHVDRLRGRLDSVRDKALRQVERIGLRLDDAPAAGMFLWVDAGCDTNVLAEKGFEENLLFAPGSLFSPRQLPSTRMRLNLSSLGDAAVLRFLERHLGR